MSNRTYQLQRRILLQNQTFFQPNISTFDYSSIPQQTNKQKFLVEIYLRNCCVSGCSVFSWYFCEPHQNPFYNYKISFFALFDQNSAMLGSIQLLLSEKKENDFNSNVSYSLSFFFFFKKLKMVPRQHLPNSWFLHWEHSPISLIQIAIVFPIHIFSPSEFLKKKKGVQLKFAKWN